MSPGSALPLLLATALLSTLSPARAQQQEHVPLQVIVNAQDMGDMVVTGVAGEEVRLTWGQLRKLGLVNWPAGLAGPDEAEVSLDALAPYLMAELDWKGLRLELTAVPELFEKRSLDLGNPPPKDIRYLQYDSAFLNYSLSQTTVENSPSDSVALPIEAAVRIGSTLAYSSFVAGRTDSVERDVRMLSNLTWDDPETRRRLTVGDFSAVSGRLGGGGQFGGVSLATNYSLVPYFVRYPQLTVSGVTTTPSEVRLLVDDQLIKTERFTPGVFEMSNVPLAIGAGEAKLVIKDAYGREQTVTLPFYVSNQLLKEGIHEYSYNVGYRRIGLGVESADYADPALLAYHRYAFADWLTAGLSAEGDAHGSNLSPSATVLLWRLGTISLIAAASREDAAQGSAYLVEYTYQAKGFGLSLAVQSQTRDYSHLSLRAGDDKDELLGSASFGVHGSVLGSLSLIYRVEKPYVADPTDTATLFYTRPVLRQDLNLNLRAIQAVTHAQKGPQVSNEYFAGVTWNWGQRASITASRDQVNGQATDTLTVQQNAPQGPGYGYRVDLTRRDGVPQNDGYGGDAFVQLNGSHGTYSATYLSTAGVNTRTLTAAGSVAYVNNGVYFSRPINDSFALVRVSGTEGVRVYSSNLEVGTTNRQGEVLDPSLIAYFGNDISIEERDVPVNYAIPALRQHIAPPYRSGAVVDFSVTKLQAVVGTLYVVSEGKRVPAELANITVEAAGKTVEAVVGRGGEFYLENIPAGTHSTRVLWKDIKCDLSLTVPKSEEVVVNLGEVTCESH